MVTIISCLFGIMFVPEVTLLISSVLELPRGIKCNLKFEGNGNKTGKTLCKDVDNIYI